VTDPAGPILVTGGPNMPAHDAIGPVTALALDVAFPALLLVIAGTAKRAV
jgi:hypothetical protein